MYELFPKEESACILDVFAHAVRITVDRHKRQSEYRARRKENAELKKLMGKGKELKGYALCSLFWHSYFTFWDIEKTIGLVYYNSINFFFLCGFSSIKEPVLWCACENTGREGKKEFLQTVLQDSCFFFCDIHEEERINGGVRLDKNYQGEAKVLSLYI